MSRCNGKIIIIDTGEFEFPVSDIHVPLTNGSKGISHAYGGALSALSIEYSLVPVARGGVEKWVETEVVRALYADKREVVAHDVQEVEHELLGDKFFL